MVACLVLGAIRLVQSTSIASRAGFGRARPVRGGMRDHGLSASGSSRAEHPRVRWIQSIIQNPVLSFAQLGQFQVAFPDELTHSRNQIEVSTKALDDFLAVTTRECLRVLTPTDKLPFPRVSRETLDVADEIRLAFSIAHYFKAPLRVLQVERDIWKYYSPTDHRLSLELRRQSIGKFFPCLSG